MTKRKQATKKKTAKKTTTRKKRPAPRDASVGTKVSRDVAKRAEAKANAEHRTLAAILRSFLLAWVDDEVETPAEREDENVRARRRTNK